MEQVTVNDTARSFVEKINGNFDEAGIASSLSYASSAGSFVDALNAKFGQPSNPVSVGDTSRVFVQNINASFDNLSPAEPVETGEIVMAMQAGQLNGGYSKNYATGTSSSSVSSDIWDYCHTTELIDISNCTITNVAKQSNETLTIYWFSNNFSQGGSVNTIGSIPANARYVRFQLGATNITPRDLTVTITGTAVRVKNIANATDGDRTRITFEVKKPYKLPTGVDYIGTDRLYDNGYIVLPSSYKPTGTPTDLAVFIQGTGGFSFNNGIKDDTYRETQSFIARNGIAVCCCSGVTSKYPSVQNLMFGPLFAESVASMVDYIKSNYNIGKVYMYGKSSGGMLTNFAPLVTYIGAVCVGSFAPAHGPITSKLYLHMTNYVRESMKTIAKDQLGATLPESTSEWKSSVVTNSEKWRKFDAFFSAYSSAQISDTDFKSIVAAAFDNSNARSIYGLMQYSSSVKTLLESITRPFPVPHMVWSAQDDTAVSYDGCDALCQLSQGYTLTTMRSGTGGHNADGSGTPNSADTYTPTGGETFYKAYWELVDWFKSH